MTAKLPPSAVPVAHGAVGALSILVAMCIAIGTALPAPYAAWALIAGAALPMLVLEYRWSGRPIPSARRPRPAIWLVGFCAGSVPFVLLHLVTISPVNLAIGWIVVTPMFLVKLWFERWRPFTSAPVLIGQALLSADWKSLTSDDVRLWAIKAFYVPLYGYWLYGLTNHAPLFQMSGVGTALFVVTLAYTVDLSFGLSGCLFATRKTVVSTQPSLIGWTACLLCYPPFLAFWHEFHRVGAQQGGWPSIINSQPLSLLGGLVMAVSLVIFVSATVMFGLRFSNLTNRGVITTGPYRLMKHPAYFVHVLNAWVITFILFPAAGLPVNLHTMIIPVAFTVLYRVRAVTEERHLSESQAYRDYSVWISKHGLLARLKSRVRNSTNLWSGEKSA